MIRPFSLQDIPDIVALCDDVFGLNYYRAVEVAQLLTQSQSHGQQFSLGLYLDGSLRGFRITLPPGQWHKDFQQPITPAQWPQPAEATAYFKTIGIAEGLAGQGWGKKLSQAAISLLRRAHAKGIVAHSWLESPHDSSTRYLRGLGFKPVAEHKDYWKMVDYICSKCQKKPCRCTAVEMYLEL